MPDPIEGEQKEEVVEKTIVDGGEGTVEKKEDAKPAEELTPEAKAAQEAEHKRILEADPATLNEADKLTRADLDKAAEEKRLLETPKEKLSAEDQVKQAALLKAKEEAEKNKGKQGAPEAYVDFKVPEGFEVTEASKPLLEDFKATAKKHNLSQEAAQEFVDLQVKHIQTIADGLLNTFNETVSGWKKETLDALGPEYKKETVFCSKAIDAYGTPELRKLLNTTGVGNNIELVKFFIAVGKTVTEDQIVDGKKKTGEKSDSQLFYGDTMK